MTAQALKRQGLSEKKPLLYPEKSNQNYRDFISWIFHLTSSWLSHLWPSWHKVHYVYRLSMSQSTVGIEIRGSAQHLSWWWLLLFCGDSLKFNLVFWIQLLRALAWKEHSQLDVYIPKHLLRSILVVLMPRIGENWTRSRQICFVWQQTWRAMQILPGSHNKEVTEVLPMV